MNTLSLAGLTVSSNHTGWIFPPATIRATRTLSVIKFDWQVVDMRKLPCQVDLYVVKEWLGHSSIQVTEKYAHLSPTKLAHAATVLEIVLDE